MGLIKKVSSYEPVHSVAEQPITAQPHVNGLDVPGLRAHYSDLEYEERRKFLKTLNQSPESLEFLTELVQKETSPLLQQATFDSLMTQAQFGNESAVIPAVVELLRTGDAMQRSAAVRFLSAFPEPTGELVPDLLQDESADIRLYALDVIQHLVHPDVPSWLKLVMENESHPNVITSAIDRALEAGCTELQGSLEQVAERFSSTPLITFAVELAKSRLSGISQ